MVSFGAMALTLIVFALTVAVVWIVGSSSLTYQVDDLGTAALSAIAMSFLGLLLSGVLAPAETWLHLTVLGSFESGLMTPSRFTAAHVLNAGVTFVTNAILLLAVGLLVPGVTIRGAAGLLIAAALLTAIDVLLPILFAFGTA